VLRALDVVGAVHGVARNESPELLGALRRTFETIAMAKVSTSAVEARQIGMLLPADRITMNRERLLSDAKQAARDLAAGGYSAPVPRTDIPAPGENMLASLKLGVHVMRQGEFISDHDVKVANWVAYVLCRVRDAGHAMSGSICWTWSGGVPSRCAERRRPRSESLSR
jgi:3-hydroxyacyl-CoA dehydrogenase